MHRCWDAVILPKTKILIIFATLLTIIGIKTPYGLASVPKFKALGSTKSYTNTPNGDKSSAIYSISSSKNTSLIRTLNPKQKFLLVLSIATLLSLSQNCLNTI